MSNFLQFLEQLVALLKPSIILILVSIPFLIKWCFYSNTKTQKNLPPSPPQVPLIGNLHQLGRFPHHSLHKLSQHYGPIMFLSLGTLRAVVISSPDGARQIMQAHDLIFANRSENKIFKKLIYNMRDITTSPHGEYWRQLKSICTQQLLSKKKVLSFRAIREEETALVMQMIKDQSCGFSKAVNLGEMFSLVSKNILCRAALGRKYDEGKIGRKFRKLWLEFFELIGTASVEDSLPWLAWINYVNGKNITINRVARELDDFLEGVVVERLALLERLNTNAETYEKLDENKEHDFLDILLRVYKDPEFPVSLGRDSIKAIIMDMFAGGMDTTSTSMEWAMAELLRHPTIMNRLQNEVTGIAKGKIDVNENDLEEMYYLKAVIKETLHYHPPVPTLIPRRSTQKVKVMGFDIPSGSLVYINAYAIGRDPLSWDDPEEFKPERFLNSPRDYKGRDFEFLPFGSGRRSCPGISFAIANTELVLANIIHKFDWKLPNEAHGEDLDMTECTGINIHKKVPLLAIPTPCSV